MTTAPLPHAELEAVTEHANRRNVDAGLVLGICSLATSYWPLIGLVLGILGVIFAARGGRRLPVISGYKGLGVVGVATSIVGICLGLLSTLAWLAAAMAAKNYSWNITMPFTR